MINRVKVLIVVNIENRPVFIDSGIIFYLDSTKIKEWLKLHAGHRLTSGLVLLPYSYFSKESFSLIVCGNPQFGNFLNF